MDSTDVLIPTLDTVTLVTLSVAKSHKMTTYPPPAPRQESLGECLAISRMSVINAVQSVVAALSLIKNFIKVANCTTSNF